MKFCLFLFACSIEIDKKGQNYENLPLEGTDLTLGFFSLEVSRRVLGIFFEPTLDLDAAPDTVLSWIDAFAPRRKVLMLINFYVYSF